MQSIGIIHTPFQEPSRAPIQASRSKSPGSVTVFPEFEEGLEGIEEFSHIYLLYEFHCSEPFKNLKVQPFLDDQLHGIFATRFPCRPNPLGISTVQLVRREGCTLHFTGADMLDGSPLLDIKPYIPEFDMFYAGKIGWYSNRKYE